MKFGIEIEAKGLSCAQVSHLLSSHGIDCVDAGYTHRVMRTWKAVRDGSLTGTSFELVSPPMEFNTENIEKVRCVVELLNEAGCSVDSQCGIHVHFEVAHLTAEHVANIFNRYRRHEEEIDGFMPSSRRRNNNSMLKSLRNGTEIEARSTVLATCQQQYCRYHKVNMTSFVKYGTMEFRHHSGSLNKAKISKWLNFLAQFIEASRPVQQAAQPVSNTISGKSRKIVDLLTANPNGLDAGSLAAMVGMTRPSVQSAVCRLRRQHGVHISSGSRYRLLSNTTATQTSVVDSCWKGIAEEIKTFYTRRAQTLAA